MQENKMEQNEVENTAPETEAVKEEAPKAEKTDKKKVKKLEEELAAANAKAEELNERYVRMLAEYDNFRKRTAKERDGIYSDAYIDALTNILPVLDNLERAEGCEDAEALRKGLELTLKSFRDTLEKMGVKEIDTTGQFDPNLHNAVMHVEDEAYGENAIAEVLMKGYQKDDKILRYSMVKVAN
ncbi:MAG: nucleotide exchange factor GrpE [Clostridia bacterium]|nr:nucleotide exchange factor GrpE [Clostridia bacterium]